MPLLAPQLISTWYLFQQNLNNQSLIRIVEDWTEQQTQELNEKKLIQGSNGTHVMDAGGIIWENTVRAPVLIINQATGYSNRYTDIFDLLSYSFNATRSPFLDPTLTFLMKSADITVDQSGGKCNITYLSPIPMSRTLNAETYKTIDGNGNYIDVSPPFLRVYAPDNYNALPDFIGRVARFYDFYVSFFDTASQSYTSFPVLNAKINFTCNIQKHYFIGFYSQTPFLSVQDYSISGTMTIMAAPASFRSFEIDPQVGYNSEENSFTDPGILNPVNVQMAIGVAGTDSDSTTIRSAQREIYLGSASMRANVTRNMSPNEITKITIDFMTYTRPTTSVS